MFPTKINAGAYSLEIPAKGYSPLPASQHHIPSPASGSGPSSIFTKQSKVDSVLSRMNKLRKKIENFALGLLENVRMGHNITKTVKWRLRLGVKILKAGGLEKVFKKLFGVSEGEKLLNASQCFFSTTAGPLAGLLFISTDKLSFYSEKSIEVSSPNGQLVRFHYKVLIPLKNIKTVDLSENVKKPSTKYIKVTTMDNFDFWFMGFINCQKAFEYLQLAISQARKN